MLRILLTGFEPFGGQTLNPSWEVARALNGVSLPGAQVTDPVTYQVTDPVTAENRAEVTAVQLPCVFAQALPALQQALAAHRPDIVLALGQAEGRCDFSIERVALNVIDARMPDNAGQQPVDVPVIAEGPAAYFSTLPIKTLVAGLQAAGFPASVSQTAGTFVCNQVFYALQHALAGQGRCSGFMHLPLLPEQAAHWQGPNLPSWPVSTQVAGVQKALSLLVAHRLSGVADLSLSAGALN
jgi:pyroglutamyl-peptidase